MNSNRRNFLKRTSLAGAGLALAPSISKASLFSQGR
ncbi:MAG: twin-arginine translocation signal domain-containing protein, partial [Pricia sp.]|nr:twin-arginine translocation signal domain-containing protein [Pricia sp.]